MTATATLVMRSFHAYSVALLVLARELRAGPGVVGSGITPLIDTGMAGRTPGTGQIGAGVVRAPLACSEQALEALTGR